MRLMRIVRLALPDGSHTWAKETEDGLWLKLEGDLFSDPVLTETVLPQGRLLAPLQPPLIIGIAQNYLAHARELGGEPPKQPVFFMKTPTSLQDPGGPIEIPRTLRSDKVDYEAELAIVIGKDCRNATRENALEYVLGYTVANDVSARDWQKEWGGGQFCRGKTFDTFCPLGPAIVTVDELGSADDLRIYSTVNGEARQDSTTSDMIFDVPTLIAFVSGSTTLPAGTVILTGTPSGVGAGFKPPRFLYPGDEVVVGIEQIGELRNPVGEEATL